MLSKQDAGLRCGLSVFSNSKKTLNFVMYIENDIK